MFSKHENVWKMKKMYRVIKKEVYTFKNLFYKYYWTYGDVLYIHWRENSVSYFHTLQTLDVNPTCDVTDAKSIIQLFPYSSQYVTGNSSHSLSDAPLQIIESVGNGGTNTASRSPTKKESHDVRSGDLGGHLSKCRSFSCALVAILKITPLGRQNYCVRTWREIQIRTLSDLLSIRIQDMDLASVVFVK
jgi:hypothetical protein